MDRIPIESSQDAPQDVPQAVVEEPIIQAKKAEDTEFAFRLPPGLDQQMGMLNSLMGGAGGGGGNPTDMFSQLMKGMQNPSAAASDSNNNPHPQQSQHPRQSDMTNKVLEQSLGMLSSVLSKGGAGGGSGADLLGSLFGGGAQSRKPQQPQPEQNKMYPTLDDLQPQEDKPNPKPAAANNPLNIEAFLNQGINQMGLDDVFGNLLGKPKKPNQESDHNQMYPQLDDLQPKQQHQSNPNKPDQLDLEKIINQGIDVIGSALKGNAGNVLGQLLKTTVSSNKQNHSSPSAPVPNVPKTYDVPEPPKNKSTFEPMPQPASTAPDSVAETSKQEDKNNNPKEKDKYDADEKPSDIIDSIPEDAFIEAFDKLI